jgi:hypothetical protein
MMRATLTAVTLLLFGGSAFCQTVNQGADGLEACFRQARLADKICEGLSNAEQRLDCFNKTRDAQLECLTHVLPGEQTSSTTPPEATPPAKSGKESENNAPDAGPPGPTTDGTSKAAPPPPKADVNLSPPNKTPVPDRETTALQSDAPPLTKESSIAVADHWIMSETTSPVDFSALVTAVVQASQPGEGGPSSLTIRCRAKRTELSLQFRGNFAGKNDKPPIDLQIDDQPATRQVWNWSADGRTAIFRDDPISLLQSLPDSTRLTIWTDDGDAGRGTGFQLSGVDAVRRKIAVACNWASQQARTSKKR